MWRLVLLGALLGACGFQIATGVAPNDDQPPSDAAADTAIDVDPSHWLTGYTHRKRIEVSSGQSITLDDFVVGVVIAADADLAAHARDDGQDLTITTAEDTILDYELERFDGATGATTIWVRVPHLESQTSLYLYYGGDIRLHDPRATWNPQTFRAVWHLTDTAGTLARDSAGMHDLTATGTTNQPVMQDGLAGAARGFDGLNDMLRDDADDNTLDFGLLESFSYSIWVLVVMSAGEYDMPMFKGGSSAGTPGFDIELGRNNWTTYVGDGTTSRGVTWANETFGTWIHLTGVVDRTEQLLIAYKDGVLVQKENVDDIAAVASNLYFVLGSSGSMYWFRGRIEEPRIYARALSSEWIAAEHANLRSPQTFAAVGAEELPP